MTAQLAALAPEQAQQLAAQLSTIDPAKVNELYQRTLTYKPPEGGLLSPLAETRQQILATITETMEEGGTVLFVVPSLELSVYCIPERRRQPVPGGVAGVRILEQAVEGRA